MTEQAAALYRCLETDWLLALRRAFMLDREVDDPGTVAFCDHRIALIDRELARRDHNTLDGTPQQKKKGS